MLALHSFMHEREPSKRAAVKQQKSPLFYKEFTPKGTTSTANILHNLDKSNASVDYSVYIYVQHIYIYINIYFCFRKYLILIYCIILLLYT